jgi:hypothetical protein
MLHADNWGRWPLHLLFTSENLAMTFTKIGETPPVHVRLTIGPLDMLPVYRSTSMERKKFNGHSWLGMLDQLESLDIQSEECVICMQRLEEKVINLLHSCS